MAKGTPSMTALLGLLAVAGFQNRDKIGAMLGKAKEALTGLADNPGSTGNQARGGELLNNFDQMFGETKAGETLSSGLNDVVGRFRESGDGGTADSWVGTSPNQQLNPVSLQKAIGDETLDELSASTGLSKADILARLSTSLPDAVDSFTPDGRLPDPSEASRFR